MISLSRIAKFVWFLSLVVFFAVIFFCYFSWPEEVAVYFDNNGDGTYSLGKSQLFYFSMGCLISLNVIILMLVSYIPQLPIEMIKLPNHDFWKSSKHHGNYAKNILVNWVNTFSAMLNIFITIWLFLLTQLNLEQFDLRYKLSEFQWLPYVWFGALFVWFGFLFARFFIAKSEQE